MYTPVLIPARNEATGIQRCLDSLPDDVTPIVIVNGCTDNTAKIAREAGSLVIELDEEGKVPAIQAGLRHLGRQALDPLLMIDADSRPISKQWSRVMTRSVAETIQVPQLVGGLVYFTKGIDPLSGVVRSMKPVFDAQRNKKPHIRGANVALNICKDALLEKLMYMPNYWPGVEPALVDTFEEMDGKTNSVFHPQSIVLTDGSRLSSLLTRVQKGSVFTHEHFNDSYEIDAPIGSTSYRTIISPIKRT